MAELTAQTTFTIQAALSTYEDVENLVLLPENAGTDALRELRYPGDVFPPIIYDDFPDRTENFDSGPLTAKPQVKAEMGLEDTLLSVWRGYTKDLPVKEAWAGDNTKSRMRAYFFRRLWEYFTNPPADDYITWAPKDRSATVYKVVIEDLSVGGQNTVSLDHLGLRGGYVLGEVILTLRIIGEVAV